MSTVITSSAPNHIYSHYWAGTANNAQSTEWQDGVLYRTNRVLSPGARSTTGYNLNAGTGASASLSVLSPVLFPSGSTVKTTWTTGPTSGGWNIALAAASGLNAVTPGESIFLSVYGLHSWEGGTAQITVGWINSSGATMSYTPVPGSAQTLSARYSYRLSGTVTVPDGAVKADLFWDAGSGVTAPSGGFAYVSSWQAESNFTNFDYFDGATPITQTYGSVSPLLIDGWAESSAGQNIINQIVGGGTDVTLQAAALRSGSFEMVFANERDALTAFTMHRAAGKFTLTDTDTPSINMTYVLDSGGVSRRVSDDRDENLQFWIVQVAYQEVAA